jgi:hypothetical protein
MRACAKLFASPTAEMFPLDGSSLGPASQWERVPSCLRPQLVICFHWIACCSACLSIVMTHESMCQAVCVPNFGKQSGSIQLGQGCWIGSSIDTRFPCHSDLWLRRWCWSLMLMLIIDGIADAGHWCWCRSLMLIVYADADHWFWCWLFMLTLIVDADDDMLMLMLILDADAHYWYWCWSLMLNLIIDDDADHWLLMLITLDSSSLALPLDESVCQAVRVPNRWNVPLDGSSFGPVSWWERVPSCLRSQLVIMPIVIIDTDADHWCWC